MMHFKITNCLSMTGKLFKIHKCSKKRGKCKFQTQHEYNTFFLKKNVLRQLLNLFH